MFGDAVKGWDRVDAAAGAGHGEENVCWLFNNKLGVVVEYDFFYKMAMKPWPLYVVFSRKVSADASSILLPRQGGMSFVDAAVVDDDNSWIDLYSGQEVFRFSTVGLTKPK